FCFFLYCCRVRRDLHSFPTRRSSDLGPCVNDCIDGALSVWLDGYGDGGSQGWRYQPCAGSGQHDCACKPERRGRGGDTSHSHSRSEEHTSELQSRENLVCRLLLEKKK